MPKKDEYVPYKRRLPEFKLYRMHPNYLDDVSQGFRSMTYSHKIDANQPMCKRETQGYKCSDTICDDQHLKDIQLTGASFLTVWRSSSCTLYNIENSSNDELAKESR